MGAGGLSLVLAASLGLAPPQEPDDCVAETSASAPVAACGARRLTLAEVDATVGATLESLREALRDARAGRLDALLEREVLGREARARGLPPVELLRLEVGARLRLPTVDDARALWEAHRDRFPGSFEAHRVDIVDGLTRARELDGRRALVAGLLERHGAWLAVGAIDLADPRADSTAVLARIGEASFRLGEIDAAIQPLPALVEEQVYEARRQAIDAWLEGCGPSDEARVLLRPPGEALLATRADQPVLGDPRAATTVVAFVDFGCANCAALFGDLVALGERGDLAVVLRDFPLDDHPGARAAARAAEAARRQGRFAAYAARLFADPLAPRTIAALEAEARAVGLDLERFRADRDSAAVAAALEQDRADGLALGVFSTPTVFVDGRRVLERGLAALTRAIDAAREP